MSKLLLSSSLLLSRLTAAAEKAHPGSWLNHPPLYIAALSHLSSILWSPSLHCVTVSLHSHLLCSLTLSLLSCSLYSCYNQSPLCTVPACCTDAPRGLWGLACKAILFSFNPSEDPHLQVKPRRNELITSSANLGNFHSSHMTSAAFCLTKPLNCFSQRGNVLADLQKHLNSRRLVWKKSLTTHEMSTSMRTTAELSSALR